jgi:hypothetical protein
MDEDKNIEPGAAERDEKDATILFNLIFYYAVFARQNKRCLQLLMI